MSLTGRVTKKTTTAPVQLVLNIIRTLITCFSRDLPLRPYIVCAAIRMFLYTFSPRQIQFLIPPTIDTYKRWIRSTRSRARRQGDTELMEQLKEDIEVLPDGASHILWIGDRHKATKFVYFFHGGGFIAPAMTGHMEWCLQAYVLAPRTHVTNAHSGGPGDDDDGQGKVAVAMLQYTLTPQVQFPAPLCQASSGLAHLLARGIRPGQIVIGGDSAGGNITTQLLGHLMHPYAGARETITLDEPLAGAFLVSPFTSGETTTRSFSDGRPCDMLSIGIFDNPKREMFHDRPGGVLGYLFPNRNLVETKAFREGKNWALMGDADEKWLDGMAQVVNKVYVTCGKHELLRDQGILLAERIRQRNTDLNVTLEVADKEAHDFILLEGEIRQVGDATQRMRTWFSRVWT